MKMMYNGTPIKSLNIKHYEIDTNSCDMIASDMQAGKTAVARGKKITGTGKSFEFASYGSFRTDMTDYVPTSINVIEISSVDYPIKSSFVFSDMKNIDFTTEQNIGNIVIDNIEYPITVAINNHLLQFNCEKTITLEVFYGKDNYML